MPSLRIERHEAIAVLTLDRPEKLNVIDEPLLRELLGAIDGLERDANARVAVITGEGDKAFAAGADISTMIEMSPAQAQRFAQLGHRVADAMELARFPIIAAVQGLALGGGCELAMACDLIYASDKARFGQPEVNLGIIPGFGGTQRLTRRVGVGRARELCMTGSVLRAEEALGIGLVDAVVAHKELMPKVMQLAGVLATKAPLALSAVKRAIFRGQDVPLAVANELEAVAFASLFGSEDQREGMLAFSEKRPPHFRGV